MWVPIILLWPLLAIAWLLLLAGCLLAGLILGMLRHRMGMPLLRAPFDLLRLACAARGLRVRIVDPTEKIRIEIG